MRTIVMSCVKRTIYGLGKLYLVSPKNLAEGIDICRSLHECGALATLGKLSKGGDDPLQIAQECQTASDAFKNTPAGDGFYLSLKPPAFNFNIEQVMPIVTTALANGHGISFDSHDHLLADQTLQLLEQVMSRNVLPGKSTGSWRFSLTLPTRWKRSMADAEWVIDKGVRARLVKGEFRSHRSCDEMEPVKGFLSLVDRLAGNIPEIAVATHDCGLAREAVSRCKDAGCSVQLELLFGMPAGNMMALSQEMRVPVRFYVPYGETLLIYGIRHFLTNPHKLLRPGLLEIFAGHKSKLERIMQSL